MSRYPHTLAYIAVVSTLALILQILHDAGWHP